MSKVCDVQGGAAVFGSKVCDTRELLSSPFKELADEFIQLSKDGTPDWRANNHVFRAWEYCHIYKALNLTGHERLCDIGSENSLAPIWIKKRHPDLHVTCVDPGMDGRLAARAEVHGVDLDIHKDLFTSRLGLFDRITCISVRGCR